MNSGTNWLSVMFVALLYMAQRPEHYANWIGIIRRALECGAEGEGEDIMASESN